MTRAEIAASLRAAMPYIVWDRHPGEGDGPTLLEETAATVEKLMGTITELDTAEQALQQRIDALPSQQELAEAERAKWVAMDPVARMETAVASLCAEVQRLRAELEKERETWIDDAGTTWTRPTAWAYAAACRTIERLRAGIKEKIMAPTTSATPTTAEEAAEFFWRFGNVGRNPEDLLKVPPTTAQLSAACGMALLNGQVPSTIDAARRLIEGTAAPTNKEK